MTFSRKKIIFDKNYGILELDNFQVRLQYWVASLCNQLLPEFSSNEFVTLHRYYKHMEDVHVTFSRKKIIFDKNYGILELDNFLVPVWEIAVHLAVACDVYDGVFCAVLFPTRCLG